MFPVDATNAVGVLLFLFEFFGKFLPFFLTGWNFEVNRAEDLKYGLANFLDDVRDRRTTYAKLVVERLECLSRCQEAKSES